MYKAKQIKTAALIKKVRSFLKNMPMNVYVDAISQKSITISSDESGSIRFYFNKVYTEQELKLFIHSIKEAFVQYFPVLSTTKKKLVQKSSDEYLEDCLELGVESAETFKVVEELANFRIDRIQRAGQLVFVYDLSDKAKLLRCQSTGSADKDFMAAFNRADNQEMSSILFSGRYQIKEIRRDIN